MQAILELETQTIPDDMEFQDQDVSIRLIATGVALLAIGLDFSELTDEQHDTLDSRKMADMMIYKNYHRWLSLSGYMGEFLVDFKQSWQDVRQVKSPWLRGPLGNFVHYITNLDSDTQIMKQNRDSLPKGSDRFFFCMAANVEINHKN